MAAQKLGTVRKWCVPRQADVQLERSIWPPAAPRARGVVKEYDAHGSLNVWKKLSSNVLTL